MKLVQIIHVQLAKKICFGVKSHYKAKLKVRVKLEIQEHAMLTSH